MCAGSVPRSRCSRKRDNAVRCAQACTCHLAALLAVPHLLFATVWVTHRSGELSVLPARNPSSRYYGGE